MDYPSFLHTFHHFLLIREFQVIYLHEDGIVLFGYREGRKKQNLKCVRFDVDGECRVLLIANRDISKGERLYYDYNGYEHGYPTEHFV